MAFLSVLAANRLGFAVLGLTNSIIYVIMLSAAFDLLNRSQEKRPEDVEKSFIGGHNISFEIQNLKPYCNEQSTSTILLANTLPSLATKIVYPFLLIYVPTSHKVIATALLAAAAFSITGLFTSKFFVFTGVVFASFSFGLGESNFMSITPLYGDASLSGLAMGTGVAAITGSLAYALMRMILSVKLIMLTMLVIPITMLVAYFRFITPLADSPDKVAASVGINNQIKTSNSTRLFSQTPQESSLSTKIHHLRPLAKYFFPLLLVYFAEYFINQGLYELIYYPEVTYLDHAAQYRWFQVAYNFGVLISRSSVEIIQLKNIWAMSLLQFVNAIIFLAHTAKLFHLPNFYLVIILIVYEGLLGGFTFVNAFYRIKKEAPPLWQEFSISAASVGDSLGIVLAGLVALPVHNALCRLYV